MNLKDLKKEISYKWKIQGFSKDKSKVSCVAYIDARSVADILDEVCGAENWQDEYYQVKNTMCCKIGIKINDEWVYKSDGGTESDYDKEKGELSDAFKRAGVKWGIGRFLYNKSVRWITKQEYESNKFKLTEYLEKNKGYNANQYNKSPQSKPKVQAKPLLDQEIFDKAKINFKGDVKNVMTKLRNFYQVDSSWEPKVTEVLKELDKTDDLINEADKAIN